MKTRADKLKIEELADKYKISEEEATNAIGAPFKFIRKTTKELSFEDGLTREEFEAKKTNFVIPAIGKMYASFYIYSQINKNKNKSARKSDK